MKKGGILNPALSRILAETGHTDMLTVCDRGFPVPPGPERLDLALVDDIPTVIDVLSAIDEEFVIDRILVAEEMIEASPERYELIQRQFPSIAIMAVPHVTFKQLSPESRAVIRTGDCTPYANIILVSG